MNIETFALGDFQTNCFVLTASDQATECVIVDPGFSPAPLLSYLKDNNLTPTAILLTHGHSDHIAGITELTDEYGKIPVSIHTDDAEQLTDSHKNLSLMLGLSLSFPPADILLNDNDTIDISGIQLTVLHTPGHTPGGISFYSADDKFVISGDALFASSIGRTDFPNGNQTQLVNGIKEKLLTLPDDTVVWPGHGPDTTINTEKQTNPFLY